MSAPAVPDVLRQLACLAEIRGSIEVPDLRQAVRSLETLPPGEIDDLTERFRRNLAGDLPSIPATVIPRLRDICCGHGEAAVRAARNGIPWLVRRLLDTGALTLDEAVVLSCDLSIVTLTDLDVAIADDRLGKLPSLAAERVVRSVPLLWNEFRPVPLGRASDLLGGLCASLASNIPQLDACTVAGDVRRFEPLARAITIVGRSADPPAALAALASIPGVDDVVHRTGRRSVIVVHQTEIDVRIAAPDEYGTVLFGATGSPGHVRHVLNLRRRPELHAREEDVYAHGGLPWIPPEVRNLTGEIEQASTGIFDRLVTRRDIRGDLHMHSTYSDGQDTLQTMILAALRLGYEYVAITDHSQSAAASRTVTLERLSRQRDEIETLRAAYPQIAILHGLEVEILPDGRLDFADAILERLDIVLASLHDPAKQDGAALTRRCIRAMRHPLVNVVTHPANQLVGRREGYSLDFEDLYAVAVETGTALEIDGAPSHLDLDGEHARAAVAAGVTVTIDSDCHRARSLEQQMTLGIGTARRGWVEARHVLNCRPIEEVRAFVAAKRSRTALR